MPLSQQQQQQRNSTNGGKRPPTRWRFFIQSVCIVMALLASLQMISLSVLMPVSVRPVLNNPQQETTTKKTTTTPSSNFVYAFLIAGCDPQKPSYLGYIYNAMITKEILIEQNSTVDVMVLLRMNTESKHTRLPPEHEEFLSKCGILFQYLPKPLMDNFHTAMMDKFRVLQLTQYQRVLYLDSDVIPLRNLDYLFQLSVQGRLEENLVLAYTNEPASGGFFMLTPHEGDFAAITKLVAQVEELGYHFNKTTGWGHRITPPDRWVNARSKGGILWDFYGAFTDQGLLYHWVKYEKKRVSIVVKDLVETWRDDTCAEGGTSPCKTKETLSNEIFGGVPKTPRRPNPRNHFTHVRPYSDFEHFKSTSKPWLRHSKQAPDDVNSLEEATDCYEFWFHVLRRVSDRYGLNIDVDNLSVGRPTLGIYPTNEQVMKVNNLRMENEKNKAEVGSGGGDGVDE